MIYSDQELSEKRWVSGITSHEQVSFWWPFSVSFLWKWKEAQKNHLERGQATVKQLQRPTPLTKIFLKQGKIQIPKAQKNDFQSVDAMGFVGCFSEYTQISMLTNHRFVFLWHACMCLRLSWEKSSGLRTNSAWKSLLCTIHTQSEGVTAHSNSSGLPSTDPIYLGSKPSSLH